MKRIIHYLSAFLLISGTAPAQSDTTNTPSVSSLDAYMETGMEVSGIRAPYYDDEGNLIARLYGGRAKMMEGGMADVTHIRIDVFEEDEQVMTVYAPQCFTRVMEGESGRILSVESEGDVLIDMEQLTISGKGFRYTSDSSRFEILSEARVLVKDSTQNMKDLEL